MWAFELTADFSFKISLNQIQITFTKCEMLTWNRSVSGSFFFITEHNKINATQKLQKCEKKEWLDISIWLLIKIRHSFCGRMQCSFRFLLSTNRYTEINDKSNVNAAIALKLWNSSECRSKKRGDNSIFKKCHQVKREKKT